MLEKINSRKNFLPPKAGLNLKFPIFIIVFLLLIYTRFVNIGWGLPYQIHPDERNMATAIQQLSCQLPKITINFPQSLFGEWKPIANWIIVSDFSLFNCFNPHFFAYGQLPLYFGYLIVYFLKFFDGDLGLPISFQEATLSLRIISAIATIINAIIIIKIINIITKKKSYLLSFISYLIVIFSPFFIQFSHFGTTESLLMMFYSAIIYYSLLFIDKKINTSFFVAGSSLLMGLSMATKVSSLIFLIVPFSVLLFNIEFLKQKTSASTFKNFLFFYGYGLMNKLVDLIVLVFLSFAVFLVFSPHNFINFRDFISSMNYESEVALGKSLVFYTRQFFNTEPFYFQLTKVFPYALGWPVFILGGLGFLGGLGWKDKKINLLRLAFLIYFIPSAMIYAKWGRFMAPVLPLMLIFAILFLEFLVLNFQSRLNRDLFSNFKFQISNFLFLIVTFLMIIPGLAYLSIYAKSDIRFQASEWIYKNIPEGSYILFETANVIDIPIENPEAKNQIPVSYHTVSFNFYDLDENQERRSQLNDHLKKADYIFIPSRRVFANHTCYVDDKLHITNNRCQMLRQKYPVLNKYYDDLFSGKLGFEKVAEFDSYPKICLPFSNKCLTFPDEQAEETWTVFDHPVIRIYKKVKS